MYDCTHCFNCIEACPKGVAPMNQIMRLRRVSGSDHHIVDRNNGDRHEKAFATLVKGYGLLHEAELLPRSYGGDSWFGKFHPAAGQELLDSLPVIMRAVVRRKVSPKGALLGHKIPKDDLKDVQRIFEKIEDKDERYELNLYITGYDEDEADGGGHGPEVMAATGAGDGAATAPEQGQPGQDPEDSPTR
jgi:succinate dehydrogenase / fumarate reductase iron-sulfur subunit